MNVSLTLFPATQGWYTFGSVLQIISALGMHRRDRRPILGPPVDYIHSEIRKRTFWSTYVLDRYLGVVLGRPRHFHDDDIDQDLPDRVNDEEMAPEGRMTSESAEDCQLDGFAWNIELARIVGAISHDLYPIKPLSETSRIELTRSLGKKLDAWKASLPAFLSTVKPSSLVRSFRRQCVALRLAYDHAVMHLYRPFLLPRRGRLPTPDATEAFGQQSVQLCIAAAQDALRTADGYARDGPLFHAFWWTHYITFCALTVAYVWNMQQPSAEIESIDRQKLMALAEQCQAHLAQATATNSPSRRYSIILEELRNESRKGSVSESPVNQLLSPAGLVESPGIQRGIPPAGQPYASQQFVHHMGGPFVHWQASDWLEVDASVVLRDLP